VSKLDKELKGVAKELGGGGHGKGKKKTSTTKSKKSKGGGASLEKQAKRLLK
jgi:hypothetical protein